MTAPAAICLVFIALIALALAIDNARRNAKGPPRRSNGRGPDQNPQRKVLMDATIITSPSPGPAAGADVQMHREQALNATRSMIGHLERAAVCARYAAEQAGQSDLESPCASMQLVFLENDLRLARERALVEQSAIVKALGSETGR